MVRDDRWQDRTAEVLTPTVCPDDRVAAAGGTDDVTRILSRLEQGDGQAAERLLPLVYEELRKLAAAKLAQEKPGQTLQATALVHEAYLRLVGQDTLATWESRSHFFAAAAEAMRRILVNRARDRQRIKRGGNRQRIDFTHIEIALDTREDDLLALDDALEKLAADDPLGAEPGQAAVFRRTEFAASGRVLGCGSPHGRPPLGLLRGPGSTNSSVETNRPREGEFRKKPENYGALPV